MAFYNNISIAQAYFIISIISGIAMFNCVTILFAIASLKKNYLYKVYC